MAFALVADKQIHLGTFNSQLEAAKQHDRCALLFC
jgi:hypothetical protein